MEWLNYHHLLYFWTVAREGSVARAAERLRLRPPTVSGQIRSLESALGEKLFARSGRSLVLTEVGRVVYGFAEEIFSLGSELLETVRGRPTGKALRFTVGVADVIPKLVAYRILEPAVSLCAPLRLVCREDRHDRLLSGLAAHELDVVLSDTPVGSGAGVRAFNHLLGESPVGFYAVRKIAQARRRGFPRSLHGAPLLLPAETTALRRALTQWFEESEIRPVVAGEFDDSALLKVFGQGGAGIFAAPTVVERELTEQYGVHPVGRTTALRERFYAISPERRLRHPAVAAICDTARSRLFG